MSLESERRLVEAELLLNTARENLQMAEEALDARQLEFEAAWDNYEKVKANEGR